MRLLINGVYFINLHMHARYCLSCFWKKCSCAHSDWEIQKLDQKQ